MFADAMCVQPQYYWTPTSFGYVTMLLNTKLPLLVTKQLVLFFAPKVMNNLLHQMLFYTV